MKRKMTMLNNEQIQQVELLYKTFGRTDITRAEINNLVKKGKIKNPSWLKSDTYKVSRGVYSLPIEGNDFSPTLKIMYLFLGDISKISNKSYHQKHFIQYSLLDFLVMVRQ